MKLEELMDLKEQTPPKDMFETGSSQQIVGWVRSQEKDKDKATSLLNFWIMKQGKHITPARKKALEFAKELLAKELA